MADTKSAKFMRGLVKFVFVGCYAAFLWASIHHVAAFFDNYEQNGSDNFGSYMLAGAIDITALVTTMGVMFFRKSMPRYALVILWVFIGALALYSWLINWEYAAHFQSDSLLMQATGQLQPVYDTHGVLHYVPQMQLNTTLLYVNPALASCFTIFALIYSVVGEFFGAKAPSAQELQARLTYLQETATIQEKIREEEEKGKGPGWIQRAKKTALEIKDAANEVIKREETEDFSEEETVEIPDAIEEEKRRDTDELVSAKHQAITFNEEETEDFSEEKTTVVSYFPKSHSWLSASGSTVNLKIVSETMNQSMKKLRNRVASRAIRATKNADIVFKDSVVSWSLRELIPVESQKTIQMKAVRIEPKTTDDLGLVERAMLKAIQNASAEDQMELNELARTKSTENLTAILKERYPKYAGIITEERIGRVRDLLTQEG